jgi:hypothetical protein
MKLMWCWRCKQEVPMLDEEEYSKVDQVYGDCIKKVRKYMEDYGVPLKEAPLDFLYLPVTLEYNRIAGTKTKFGYEAIMCHPHRISSQGPACKVCGKPLRLPKAKKCVFCGSKVEET